MKAKQLVIAGLALAALVACNKEKAVETPLMDGDAYINVKITYSDPVTKGTVANPPFYFGTAEEQAIDNAYFVFYYADGSFCQYVKKGKDELKFTSNGENASTDKNVEELSDAVVVLRNLKSNLYPVYMAVILNSDDNWINTNIKDKSISEATSAVQTAIATAASDNALVNWSNFMMSSSSFNNGDARTGYFCTKLTPTNFQESEEKAVESNNPVEAYVERLAAKVKVEFGTALQDGGKIGSFEIDGNATDLFFKVTGWGLNATTKDSYCFKNINASWTDADLGFGWNDVPNFRSYWAQSTNYGTGDYPKTFNSSDGHYKDDANVTLNYITYNDLKVAINGNAYCRENTNTAEYMNKNLSSTATSVLLGAKIVDKDGNAVTLYNYNGKLYTESNYKAAALNDYEAKNTDKLIYKVTTEGNNTKYTQIGVADLKIEISADGYAHVELIDAANYCYGAAATIKDNHTAVTSEEANKLLNGTEQYKYNTGCSFYRDGMMYYNIPIEHLRGSVKTAGNYTIQEGDYGVVRNHYYIITITKIKNLGKAVNEPDEVIVPNDDDTKSYYVAAKINVLSWKVVRQTVEL